jgi:glyoxylase-like metal-dependent hydrolase (beta-lactamase superfamily II)
VLIRKLTLGPIQANCFILGCEQTREAVVIDPGDEGDRILMSLAEEKLTVKAIANTHGHFDHVGANSEIKRATGAPLMIHAQDAPMLGQLSQHAAAWGLKAEDSPAADRELVDGDEIIVGQEIRLKVLHTPGHTLGGVSLYSEKTGDVFVGDTLFAGSIGRTDFPGGDYNTLISSIHTKLFTLPEDVKVHPGHMHETTIGQEKRTNPFVR